MSQGSQGPGTAGAKPHAPAGTGLSDVGESLQTLEQGVADMVHDAGKAAGDSVATIRAAVGDTVGTIRGAVRESVASLKSTFDLGQHVREHPWIMLGGAAIVGYLAGSLFRRLRQ